MKAKIGAMEREAAQLLQQLARQKGELKETEEEMERLKGVNTQLQEWQ